jgi:hypothetical protein
MAKYDQCGGCACGLYKKCECENKKHKILVTGGRDYQNKKDVYERLYYYCNTNDLHPSSVCIIHGGCHEKHDRNKLTGADRWADEWARENSSDLDVYYADWETHGRAAGPIRNSVMLKESKPDVVISFPGGRGTSDMTNKARKAGIKVIEE